MTIKNNLYVVLSLIISILFLSGCAGLTTNTEEPFIDHNLFLEQIALLGNKDKENCSINSSYFATRTGSFNSSLHAKKPTPVFGELLSTDKYDSLLLKHIESNNKNLAINATLLLLFHNKPQIIIPNIEKFLFHKYLNPEFYLLNHLEHGMIVLNQEEFNWKKSDFSKLFDTLLVLAKQKKIREGIILSIGFLYRNKAGFNYMMQKYEYDKLKKNASYNMLYVDIKNHIEVFIGKRIDSTEELEKWAAANLSKQRYEWLCDLLNRREKKVDKNELSKYLATLILLIDKDDYYDRWFAKEILLEYTEQSIGMLLNFSVYNFWHKKEILLKWQLWWLKNRTKYPKQVLPEGKTEEEILTEFANNIKKNEELYSKNKELVEATLKEILK